MPPKLCCRKDVARRNRGRHQVTFRLVAKLEAHWRFLYPFDLSLLLQLQDSHKSSGIIYALRTSLGFALLNFLLSCWRGRV